MTPKCFERPREYLVKFTPQELEFIHAEGQQIHFLSVKKDRQDHKRKQVSQLEIKAMGLVMECHAALAGVIGINWQKYLALLRGHASRISFTVIKSDTSDTFIPFKKSAIAADFFVLAEKGCAEDVLLIGWLTKSRLRRFRLADHLREPCYMATQNSLFPMWRMKEMFQDRIKALGVGSLVFEQPHRHIPA